MFWLWNICHFLSSGILFAISYWAGVLWYKDFLYGGPGTFSEIWPGGLIIVLVMLVSASSLVGIIKNIIDR